ncbi:peptidylprolyl isomerase [Streptomyces sp. NPDC058401]|uniref:peptidylprolyl isomerase n=1 Tax=Streptomyces sp. NPDC058401 TaxID=3346480 RepID=UPI0036587128
MNWTDGKPGPAPEGAAGPAAAEPAPESAPGAEADAKAGAAPTAAAPGGVVRRPAVRKAATALAAAAACSGLIWSALSLTETPHDSKPAAAPAPAGCTYTPTTAGPGAVPVHDPARARPYTAELVTDQGKVTIEAFTGAAPCATTSFAFLAGKKYFDGSACHRVTTSGIFVLECGDPAGGSGRTDPGYHFPDENLSGAAYPAGTVALSKAQPGRNGSRFFISYADPKLLMQPDWTPFGRVVGGLDVLRKIAANGTADGSADGRPRQPVVFRSVTVHQTARN